MSSQRSVASSIPISGLSSTASAALDCSFRLCQDDLAVTAGGEALQLQQERGAVRQQLVVWCDGR
jgi:hypothetical protein